MRFTLWHCNYVSSENTANQVKEVESSESAVNIRQLLALVFSAGGVQAMTAIVGILTIKFVSPLGSQTIAAVTGGQRLIFIVLAIMLGVIFGPLILRFSIAYLLLTFGAGVEWIFATIVIDYLVKTAIVGWRTKYHFDALAAAIR